MSNGHSGTSTPSYVVTGSDGFTLEPFILRTNHPFDGPGKRRKTTLSCTNGEKGNLQTLCTIPPAFQSTKVSNR